MSVLATKVRFTILKAPEHLATWLKEKKWFAVMRTIREENYLSYLYLKFYIVAGHVGSLRKATSFGLGGEDRR